MSSHRSEPRRGQGTMSASGRPRDRRSSAGVVVEERIIRAEAPPYRWVCPCQAAPVLLATYDLDGHLNIKVRDRYWHLYGFGHVQAICPRCGAEHLLDLRALKAQITETGHDRSPNNRPPS